MASLGGRRNPRGVAFGAVPDERGLAPPDTATTRPGDRTDGDGSSDWITLTALAAAAIFVCYADRSNISTAIIPMAEAFSWDKIAEGGVLSAFFYGYALTQIVGGRAADRFGGKNVLLFGVVAWSLATFFTPAAAAAGTAPLLLARVSLGAGEGVAFPAVHALIARHVPLERRTTAVATVTAASYAGAAFAFGATPRLVLAGGWEAAFYAFGAAALLWVPLWVPARFQVVTSRDSRRKARLGDARATTRAIDDRRPTRRFPTTRQTRFARRKNHPTTNASARSASGGLWRRRERFAPSARHSSRRAGAVTAC